jgi:hypothetical protein
MNIRDIPETLDDLYVWVQVIINTVTSEGFTINDCACL